ncbi:MAG: nucleoside phosphorylase [Bacteroidaceae bacterium]|nr:nucleoside phosphorylase [Bacteroidaceae bacterium]
MRIAESELIINDDGSAFHLHIRPEQLADKVILVGDPDRIRMMAEFFDEIEFRNASREFISLTGRYHGTRITCLSTGIGADNVDIVMNELDALANIDFATREVKSEHRTLTILRIGTCGAIQPDIPLGSYILSHYSIGLDGLLNWYADREKITDLDMEKAFAEHIHKTQYMPMPYFAKASDSLIDRFQDCTVKGMTLSAPGFYGPQGRVLRMQLALPDMLDAFESFRYGDYRITNFEMEGSAIAGIARHLGHEAATICCAIANRYQKNSNVNYHAQVAGLVRLALDRLAEM